MKVLISFYSVKHSLAETKKKDTMFVIILLRHYASTSNNMLFVSEYI
jgi:hypothetical protein